MKIIAQDTPRFSNLVKHEYEASIGYCREAAVVNDAAQTLLVGAVLGKVTATGKYVVAKETATDGSKVPAALVIEETAIGAKADTRVLTLVRGAAIVSKDALILDATYDTDAKKQAVYDALEAKGILVNETI